MLQPNLPALRHFKFVRNIGTFVPFAHDLIGSPACMIAASNVKEQPMRNATLSAGHWGGVGRGC